LRIVARSCTVGSPASAYAVRDRWAEVVRFEEPEGALVADVCPEPDACASLRSCVVQGCPEQRAADTASLPVGRIGGAPDGDRRLDLAGAGATDDHGCTVCRPPR
jgi:hypothetical protein